MAKAIITLTDVGDSYVMAIDFPSTDKGGREKCPHSRAIEKAIRIFNDAFSDSVIHLHITTDGYVISGIKGQV